MQPKTTDFYLEWNNCLGDTWPCRPANCHVMCRLETAQALLQNGTGLFLKSVEMECFMSKKILMLVGDYANQSQRYHYHVPFRIDQQHVD